MRFTKALLFLGLAAFAGGMTSCKDNDDDNKPVVTEQIPTTYNFENVNYKGQTVRLLLADSMIKIFKGLEKPGTTTTVTKAQLEALYDNTGNYFSDITTGKKISDKIFGGTGGELDKNMRNWFDTIAVRSTKYAGSKDATTNSQGLYLLEYVEKNLMGGLFYYQAMNYLNNEVPVADNNTVVAGEGTQMEHNWDEAFGYFGAAREFNKLTDTEIAANPSQKDFNNDGKIDVTSEKNFFFARYAGNRDKNYAVFTSAQTDFTKDIFDAFIKGRYYIGKKDYAKRDEAANTIKATWDKIIGASAVHYADGIKTNIATPGANNGRWAELKLFVEMTQFNNATKLNAANYNTIRTKLGEKPADITLDNINEIISILKSAYGF